MKFIGIDLGTTNCALASEADATASLAAFAVPQVVRAGEVAAQPTLPSFLLMPSAQEVAPAAMALPWHHQPTEACIGVFARDRGAELPHRLVSSAKSWLMARGDKRAAMLPVHAGAEGASDQADDRRISPVWALARYLEHLRAAWDDAHPSAPMAAQSVAITVPASFDPSARELVQEAAAAAGLGAPLLIEEPLAAFYAWLARHEATWQRELSLGDVVLVMDVGGGTTDFSLVEVTSDGGELALARIAVGDHILLGGDNMDALLAHQIAAAWTNAGKTLTPAQMRALHMNARAAKEALLGETPPATYAISVLGGGSKLLGQTLRAELTLADVTAQLVDGFFPRCEANATPLTARAALRTAGLPYAADPAITKHLAAFLAKAGRMPTAVLFNGGVMAAAAIERRVCETLAGWTGRALRVLAGNDLNTAVALGAAHYGAVRARGGMRVKSGIARSYYIGVAASVPAIPGFAPPMKAVCVATKGLEEGTAASPLPGELMLQVGDTEVFQFFAGDTDDAPGFAREVTDAALEELPPLSQTITSKSRAVGDAVAVVLQASVSALGEFEILCRDVESAPAQAESWRLSFSLREGTA